jgi:magnesium chelatase family protein
MTRTKHPTRSHVLSIALNGLDASLMRIEATAVQGPADFQITGLTEAQARESRVRVRAGLQQIGMDINAYGITVQVGPTERPKSAGFDVPIAMAVLGAIGHLPSQAFHDTALLGELSLTGVLRPVRGLLPALRGAVAQGVTRAVVPKANALEAAATPGIRVLVADHLYDLVRYVREGVPLESTGAPPLFPVVSSARSPDLADIRGMHVARRALEIAAAGGHHLLLIGQPGAGKTMLARRMPGILPPLLFEEALEVTALHSVAGLLTAEVGLMGTRPFRAPHHTVSGVGLGGGGDPVRPGEVSLAHQGVLFLDELLEFRTSVMETLRQPLDEGRATICRARTRTTFPARALLVGAINPCPCGFTGDRSKRCVCSPERLRAYRAKLSGPLFDRFDVHVVLPPVDVAQFQSSPEGEPTREVQKRVIAARIIQEERAKADTLARTNAQLSPQDLEQVATPDAAGARLLAQAMERQSLSAIAYGRVLRVARTIADLDGSEGVRAPHVAEAVHAVLLPPRATAAESPT